MHIMQIKLYSDAKNVRREKLEKKISNLFFKNIF